MRVISKLPISQQSTILTTLEYPPQTQKVFDANYSADKAIRDMFSHKSFVEPLHQDSAAKDDQNPFKQGPKLHHYKKRLNTSSSTRNLIGSS